MNTYNTSSITETRYAFLVVSSRDPDIQCRDSLVVRGHTPWVVSLLQRRPTCLIRYFHHLKFLRLTITSHHHLIPSK